VGKALLRAGAAPNAKSGAAQQTALHIIAAGGAYSWSDVDGICFPQVAASSDQSYRIALLDALLSSGADPIVRDCGLNTPAHLACAAGNLPMVELLFARNSRTFDSPFRNARRKTPKDLATEGVRGFIVREQARLAEQRRELEAKAKDLAASTSIDSLVDTQSDVSNLLAMCGIAVDGSVSTPAPALIAHLETDRESDGMREKPPPSPAKDNGTSEDVEEVADKWTPSPAARLLQAELHFESRPFHVVLTRHSLHQLKLLRAADEAKCHAALRLLHQLADGVAGTVLLEAGGTRPVPLFSSTVGQRGASVFIVWEASVAEGRQFYEATRSLRVWSIEPTADNLKQVAEYVQAAWELGASAVASGDDAGDPFPMGTTSAIDRPGETWYPVHAELSSDEVTVPFIVKFFALTGTLVRFLLMLPPKDDGELNDFQLPMILDARELSLCSGTSLDTGPCSTLVVGRSGTGKTSIVVQLLYDTQVANLCRGTSALAEALRSAGTAPLSISEANQHCNVLFVTKSLTLCHQVERQHRALMSTLGAPSSPLSTVREHYLAGRQLPEPMFVSSGQWLVLLDHALSDDRTKAFFTSEKEEADFLAALSGSTDSLASVFEPVEQGAAADDPSAASDAANSHRGKKHGAEAAPRKLLTFERFRAWLHEDPRFRSGQLSASTIYREIFSYIKGSSAAMKTARGYLSREQYLALPEKLSDLPSEQRASVYDRFEFYRLKCSRAKVETYDLCDLLFHLHQLLDQRPATDPAAAPDAMALRKPSPLHKVLVDEVQDLSQAELSLLLKVGADINQFHIFGDTAQTISRGVGFRFADVRVLFHEHEARVPPLHELAINYRTHAGIVSCSSSLVRLLLSLFPTSIDALEEPECGHFPGPPPALLPDVEASIIAEVMLAADEVGLQEMGANQAVLVRNTEAKERLPFELRNGLVLTVEESKGLEFDDIAIFDFFSDSPCTKEWHTLYGELPEESAAALGCERRSEFNPLLDGLLVEELKALYVALTRARKRCFIFDASEEKRKPMFDYLGALGVAEQGLDQQLSASTSKAGRTCAHDWVVQGGNFFANKLFSLAEKCFLRGGDQPRALEAGAARLSLEAKDAPTASERASLYQRAGGALVQSCAHQTAAERRRPNFARAAAAYLTASEALPSASEADRARRCKLYSEAALIMRHGLNRPREAASAFVLAATESPREAMGWGKAVDAMQAAEAFAGKEAACASLQLLVAGNFAGGDIEAVNKVRQSAEQLRSWLMDEIKRGSAHRA